VKTKNELKWITNVEVKDNYTLFLTFNDGKKGLFDVKPYLTRGSIFRELQNPAVFKTVRLSDYPTIEWANGADLCPDCVYAQTKFI